MFDKNNVYLYLFKEKTYTVFSNHKVVGVQSVDDIVCYALCQKTDV